MTDASPDPNLATAHGVADWPYGRTASPLHARPATLPDGRPWPRLRVLTVASGNEPRLADGIASVARQDYPECRHDVVPPGPAALDAILADASVDHVLVLRAGDLLAPGALAALTLDAVLSGAGAVAGLRVLFDATVTGLDVPCAAGLEAATDTPFTGGEILWARTALGAVGGLDPADPPWAARAWATIAGTEAGIARIGRPVLLQFDRAPAPGSGSEAPPMEADPALLLSLEAGYRIHASRVLKRGSLLPGGEGQDEGRELSGEVAPLTPALSPWERERRPASRDPSGPGAPHCVNPAAEAGEGGERVAPYSELALPSPPLLRRVPSPAEGGGRSAPSLAPGEPSDIVRGPKSLSIAALTGTGHVGGAGIAHRRLGEALRLAGHRVADLVLTDESPPAAAEWTDAFPAVEAAIEAGGHDLVLAGNLHGATRSLALAGRLAARLPVALVLHDLFPLTGRCAHPRDCTRIEASGCDAACPTPDEYPQLARSRIAGLHAAKRAVLAEPDGPMLLANSAWTAARAAALAPPGTAIAALALAFPTSVFRPGDRPALRRALGLPADDLLILVSAVVLDGPDKNVDDLCRALRRVAGPGIGYVAIGRLDHPSRLALPNLFAPGSIADEAQLAAWYGACDLHVTASRLETLGQTPIEAGLCGTPTLAYRTAGLTTSVIDGVSGRLVPVASGALGDALVALVADRPALARLGAFARIALEGRFSPAASAMSLDRIFRERGLLGGLSSSDAGRLRFAPAMLGHFPFAAVPAPAAAGLVAAPSNRLVRGLRRAKQRLLGRRLPWWARRGLHLAARLRSLGKGT